MIGADGELPSWLYSGNGKLRYDDDHQGLRVSRAFLDYRGRIRANAVCPCGAERQ